MTEDKLKFIELRAKGCSFETISKKLNKSKQTLVDWSKELQEEIANCKAMELEALYEQFYLLKEARISNFGAILTKVTQELKSRDLSKVSTARLLELYLLYYDKLSSEFIEPVFKSSEDIAEDKIDRTLLENIGTLEVEQK